MKTRDFDQSTISQVPSQADCRHVEGWPGYVVDADGDVWSCNSRYGFDSAGWRRLAPCTTRWGYRAVVLNRRGVHKMYFVHKLVIEAFVGPRPAGLETRHLDGNPANNRIGNLKYGTKAENAADAIAHGKHPCLKAKGEGNPKAKLTESQVLRIRTLGASGMSPAEISRTGEFSVSPSAIQRIVNGSLWGHVNQAKGSASV